MRRLDIGELRGRLPSEVSGGEMQRAAIARALINSPRLVLADEPSGNLDEDTGASVVALFLKLVREEGASLLVVTHDQKLIAGADERFLLEHGRIERQAG
jgi:ABC-type lipoprotein export system ATPase subunit